MKYPYHVKHDGILYAPGEDVPVDRKPESVVTEDKPSKKQRRKYDE